MSNRNEIHMHNDPEKRRHEIINEAVRDDVEVTESINETQECQTAELHLENWYF